MFTPYEKMANASGKWKMEDKWTRDHGMRWKAKDAKDVSYLEFVKKHGSEVGLWAASEKIHGANFCLVCDEGKEVNGARRNAILEEKENFFNHKAIVSALNERVCKLFELVRNKVGEKDGQTVRAVLLYGELFGGFYPTPASNNKKKSAPVQTEILYTPDFEFLAFDIAYRMQDKAREGDMGAKQYFGFGETLLMCDELKIPTVHPVFIGPFADCLGLSVDFPTNIPSRFGLPALQNNTAEGLVVRPLLHLIIDPENDERALLKRKGEKFLEQTTGPSASAKANEPPVEACKRMALKLVNRNRVINLISKLGRDNFASAGLDKNVEAVKDDVFVDLNDDAAFLSVYIQLTDKVKKSVEQAVRDALKPLVEKEMGK